jgi:hypothetical protein
MVYIQTYMHAYIHACIHTYIDAYIQSTNVYVLNLYIQIAQVPIL